MTLCITIKRGEYVRAREWKAKNKRADRRDTFEIVPFFHACHDKPSISITGTDDKWSGHRYRAMPPTSARDIINSCRIIRGWKTPLRHQSPSTRPQFRFAWFVTSPYSVYLCSLIESRPGKLVYCRCCREPERRACFRMARKIIRRHWNFEWNLTEWLNARYTISRLRTLFFFLILAINTVSEC